MATYTTYQSNAARKARMRPHNPIKRAKILCRSMATRLRGRRTAHLLHIAKTGGTALKHALSGIHQLEGGLELVLHSHKTRLIDVPLGDAVFFCCRDPISRYQSGFMSRQRQGRPRNFIPWSEDERFAFTRFSDPVALADALASADPSLRSEAEAAFRGIGHVNTPLRYWLGSESLLEQRKADIIWIGLQSELDEDFGHLARVLSLPTGTSLPGDDVAAHRNPGRAQNPFTEEGHHTLLERFEDDARLFEWCLRHRADLSSARNSSH